MTKHKRIIQKYLSQHGSKTPQTILQIHIKIKVIKIIGKNTKTQRTLNFINQFALGYQLVCQTQQSRNYNHITIQ